MNVVNVCKKILQHVKEYCQEAGIHGVQHIASPRLAIFERLVSKSFSWKTICISQYNSSVLYEYVFDHASSIFYLLGYTVLVPIEGPSPIIDPPENSNRRPSLKVRFQL